MPDKKCPNCGLWNVSSAVECECGYEFPGIKPIPSIPVKAFPPIHSSSSRVSKPSREIVPPGTQKCPYCEGTINSEALACRHCGRELPDPGGVNPAVIKKIPGVGAQAAKLAGVITLLAAIGLFISVRNDPIEETVYVLLSLPLTFLIYWAILSAGIAIWRKVTRK